MVSILTRLEGRVQPGFWVGDERPPEVSILTRLEGRVQRSMVRNSELHACSFNPHPTRRSGAT